MGGDHGPSVVIPAVARALAGAAGGVRFLLHGDEAAMAAELAKHPAPPAAVEVRHAERVIGMDEKPAQALRRGKGTSMWNAVEAVREGEAAAAVSAGNTGALMAISKLILRMSADLDRPALVASYADAAAASPPSWTWAPTSTATPSGWSSSPSWARPSTARPTAWRKPTVGLLNVGSEEMKGHEEVREAHRLLREGGFDLDYRGFVEGDDITSGAVDVVVTDGFTGNVALKAMEGAAALHAATSCARRFTLGPAGHARRAAGPPGAARVPRADRTRRRPRRCSASTASW